MNLKEVIQAVDAAVVAKTGRHLCQVRTIFLLQGLLRVKLDGSILPVQSNLPGNSTLT